MAVIETDTFEGKVLFGGQSNKYYSEPHQRQFQCEVMRDARGRYVARVYIGAIRGGKFAADRECITSPVYGSMDELQPWVDEVKKFCATTMTGQIGGPLPDIEQNRNLTICPECDTFNTIVATMQAYGDRYQCNVPDCHHDAYYSIGD